MSRSKEQDTIALRLLPLRVRPSRTVAALFALLSVSGLVAGAHYSTSDVQSALLPADFPAVRTAPAAPTAARLPLGGARFQPNYSATATSLRHWDKRVVTVHVNFSKNEKRSDADTLKLVARSLALWNTRIGNHLALTLTDNPNADMDVSFAPAGTLSGGAIGRTDVTFRMTDEVLMHASVRLTERLSSEELVQVAAHEIGHALGVQGHSNDKRDLMYAFAHVPAVLTDRDVNTMSVGYQVALTGSPEAAYQAALPLPVPARVAAPVVAPFAVAPRVASSLVPRSSDSGSDLPHGDAGTP